MPMQQYTPYPIKQFTLEDLENLANSALMPDEENDEIQSINAQRIQYKFWLRTDNEQELALMQYLDILRANRKLQPFLKLAARMAILETFGYTDKSDDICDVIEDIFNKIDWTRE